MTAASLPAGMRFFERGWLSSNNLLLLGEDAAVLIDSSHVNHAEQTLALVRHELQGRPLQRVLNTHLHSDHCGGNGALQAAFAELPVDIPPGGYAAAVAWDEAALSFRATGQRCARFLPRRALQPGTEEELAGQRWQLHAAPGHDPHSLIFFQPDSGVLVSADALWGKGFGVVFPELDGEDAFNEVARTLDLIESLKPRIVLPGHGPAFSDVPEALARARSRLERFVQSPQKHRHHALKVLLKFHLLEVQRQPLAELLRWAQAAPLLHALLVGLGAIESDAAELGAAPALTVQQGIEAAVRRVLGELVASGVARWQGDEVFDA